MSEISDDMAGKAAAFDLLLANINALIDVDWSDKAPARPQLFPGLTELVFAVRQKQAQAIAAAIAAERERCAKIVEDHSIQHSAGGPALTPRGDGDKLGLAYATAIRSGE